MVFLMGGIQKERRTGGEKNLSGVRYCCAGREMRLCSVEQEKGCLCGILVIWGGCCCSIREWHERASTCECPFPSIVNVQISCCCWQFLVCGQWNVFMNNDPICSVL